MLQVGADGVTDGVVRALDEALDGRELLKLRVLEAAPDSARATADRLVERLPGIHVPQVIGRTIVVYRPFDEEPEITFPS